MRFLALFVGILAGCDGSGSFYQEVPALGLTVDSPEYGAFVGDEPVTVSGQVTHPSAAVYIQERQVPVDDSGRFEVQVPVDGPYLNVDVQAFLVDQHARERRPVFSGHDPLETWPGGLTLRVTQEGLDRLGEELGPMIDDAGWDQALAGLIPTVDSSGLVIHPKGVTHSPSVLVLKGAEDGLDLWVELRDVTFDMDIESGLLTGDLSVGYERIDIGARAQPVIDEDGMVRLQLSQGTVALSDGVVLLDGSSNFVLELVMDGIGWALGGVGELVADLLLGAVGDIPLGGPFDFDTNLLGKPISVRLADLHGDPLGLAGGLAMGIGSNPPKGTFDVPAPGDLPRTQLALGLHEGLFQLLLDSDLLDLMTQQIELGGVFGTVLEVAVEALPQGHTAPTVDAWCVSFSPGDARVARLQEGIDPLAAIYLPDFQMHIGYRDGSALCEPWLDASLAVDLGLAVKEGTALDLRVDVPEGAVLYYGAEGDWTEDEVVASLGGFLDTVMGLLGSQLQLDLADILAGGAIGGLGDMAPEITGSTPMVDAQGEPVEGLYAVSLRLWE